MVEPLKDILSIYENKMNVFMYYLNKDISILIKNLNFLEDDILYLDDTIVVLSKNTLEYFNGGIVTYAVENFVTFKTKNQYSITINKDDYYVFYKRSSRNTKFNTLKSLIKILE